MALTRLQQRQLDLGPAGYFRPEAEVPPANQVRVKGGFLYSGAYRVRDKRVDQLTAGFASVSLGFKRWDLVYLNEFGVATITGGTPVGVGAAEFEGAPGWPGPGVVGPVLPDNCVPVAWVLITETGAPVVVDTDITPINGVYEVTRQLSGYYVDKGAFGAAPTGSSSNVTTMFVGETPLGGTTLPGIVTVLSLNYIHLVDQTNDEIIHAASSGRVFGRLTETGAPAYPATGWVPAWTLTYRYIDALGVEQTVTNISTDCVSVPTDVKLVGTPKVFSENDPSRPLFDSTLARLSDQVAGDIPDATETVRGKALFATDGETTALEAVQGSDVRLTGITARANAGATTARRPRFHFLNGSNVTVTVVDDGGADNEVEITIAAAGGGFPGFGGTPPASSGAGGAGGSGTASRSDHFHPLSTDYRIVSSFDANGTSTAGPFSVALGGGQVAEFGFLFGVHLSTDNFTFGFARRTPAQQFSMMIDGDGGGSSTINTSAIGHTTQGATATWTASWSTTTMTVTRSAGTVNLESRILGVIGNRY
jgi:hypothetical protein